MRHAPSVRAADKGAVPGSGRHPDGETGGATGGFQREAVPQACGLRNGLFGLQGGVHLPQRRGGQHGDLKKVAVGTPGLCQVPPTAFSVCGNREQYMWKFAKN